MSIILWLISNPTIIAIVAGVIGALGYGFKQRRAGAQAERDKQARARVEAIKDRKEIDDEVDSLAPADLDTRFKRWMSDDRG